MELLGCIDAMGASAYRQVGAAQCRQPQQVTGPGILEGSPGKMAFLADPGHISDSLPKSSRDDLPQRFFSGRIDIIDKGPAAVFQ